MRKNSLHSNPAVLRSSLRKQELTQLYTWSSVHDSPASQTQEPFGLDKILINEQLTLQISSG